jgi:hypothetical protein
MWVSAPRIPFSLVSVAGVVGGAGTVAVGISNTTVVTDTLIEAYIGSDVVVKGRGKKSSYPVYTGSTTTPGAWQLVAMKGVWVTAVSSHAVRSFAVGGVGSGNTGVAGSATVSVLVDTIKAHIDSTASVNAADGSSEDDQQSVNVLAAAGTTLWGVAGALAGARHGRRGSRAGCGRPDQDGRSLYCRLCARPE